MTAETTRRRVLAGMASGAVATTAATAIAAIPATVAEPIAWTIADDKFGCFFFCKGDKLLLSPLAEPMRQMGFYVVSVGEGFELRFVLVGDSDDGKPSRRAWAKSEPEDIHAERYDPLGADAPNGHHILWHAPTFGAAAADGGHHG